MKQKNGRKLDIRAFLTKKKFERLNQIEAEQNLPKSETDIRIVPQNQYPEFLSQKTQPGGAAAQYMDQTKSERNTAESYSTPLGNTLQLQITVHNWWADPIAW